MKKQTNRQMQVYSRRGVKDSKDKLLPFRGVEVPVPVPGELVFVLVWTFDLERGPCKLQRSYHRQNVIVLGFGVTRVLTFPPISKPA